MLSLYLRLPILLLVVVLLCGCGTYKMSVNQGSFDTSVPPTVRGAEFEMPSNSSASRLTLGVQEYARKTTKLSKVKNGASIVCYKTHCSDIDEYSEILPPTVADISYVFTSFPVTFEYEHLQKGEIRYISYGVGLDPMPYGEAAVGLNFRFGEMGLSSYFGLDFGKTKYNYDNISYTPCFITCGDDIDHDENTDYNSWQFHFRGGIGAYMSLFLGNIALTYSPQLNSPWLWKTDLNTKDYWGDDGTDYDISFDFPKVISNYFGVSYDFHKYVQYSMGVTVLNGWQLYERLYFLSSSISYIF